MDTHTHALCLYSTKILKSVPCTPLIELCGFLQHKAEHKKNITILWKLTKEANTFELIVEWCKNKNLCTCIHHCTHMRRLRRDTPPTRKLHMSSSNSKLSHHLVSQTHELQKTYQRLMYITMLKFKYHFNKTMQNATQNIACITRVYHHFQNKRETVKQCSTPTFNWERFQLVIL